MQRQYGKGASHLNRQPILAATLQPEETDKLMSNSLFDKEV